jgi:hypothetical protein
MVMEGGMWRSSLLAVMLSFSAVQAFAEEEIDVDRKFEDWSVFFAEDDCWIASFFNSKTTDEVLEVYYFVAFHRSSPVPRISIAPSEGFKLGETVSVNVGEVNYEFIAHEGMAYPMDDDEMRLFKSMLNSEPLTSVLVDVSGSSHEAYISYDGFRDAYNYISRECSFNFNSDLSDTEGVEPT